MTINTGLVLKRAAEYRGPALAALKRAGIKHAILTLSSLAGRRRKGKPDVLIFDGTVSGVRKAITARQFDLPIILLADRKSEKEAAAWLERGAIADYVLTSRAQIERLPVVVRSVLARTRRTGPGSGSDGGGASKELLQEAVYQIARAADEAEDLEALLPRIHAIVGTVMPARNFYIALHNSARETITFAYFVDEVESLTSREISVGNGLTAYVLRTGKSLLITNARQRVMLRNEGVEGVGTGSAIWLGVPLFVDKVPIGVMAVQHYENDSVYGATEQKMLEFVSSQVAMVIRRQQVYDALRASEESFRSVFENATVGIMRSTPDGQIIFANPALVRMLGFDGMDDLKGNNRSTEGIVDGYLRRDFIQRIERDGEVRGYESVWVRADGSQIYVRESARVVHGLDGIPLYYEGIVEDISERRQAEMAVEERTKEQERLSRASAALLESMSGDIRTVCSSIANLLTSEFNFSNCSIWLVRENSTLLELGALAGPFEGQIQPVSLPLEGQGVIAKSVRTGEIINLPDVLDSVDYLQSWEKTRSEMVVPLRTGERILGAIDLQSEQLAAYTPADQRLIDLIASRAALMLEHVRLYQQTERRLGQLTVLSNIDSAIASSLDLQVTLNLLVAQLSTHLQADAVSALLLNPHLQMLEYAAGRGFRGQAIQRVPLLLGEDQAGVAALERRVVSVADISSPDIVLNHPERIAGEKFVSMFAMPLIAKGQVRGVLEIYFRRLVESDPEWTHFLEILARQAAVAVEDARLFNEIQRSFTELVVAYDAAIEGWSRIIQLRQREPEEMLRRLTDLTLGLARRMGVPEALIANIYRGVLLHDIGKLAVPESVLYKTGPLTDEEWEMLHHHPVFARDLLQSIPYLRASVPIPYCHQENWDGSGYPRGLSGEDIPLEARIFSVVNAWLRMQFDRPYAQAADSKTATAYLRKQAGAEFDPQVVVLFCEMLEEDQNSNLDPDRIEVN